MKPPKNRPPLDALAPKILSRVRSGIWDRGLTVAKLSMSAGLSSGWHKLRSIAGPGEDAAENLKARLLAQAKALAGELNQLKGSLMKVGQVLSLYGEYFLPPEVNQVLKSLQSDSTPVAWPVIREVLKTELGDERLQELTLETDSMGAASLGQVHAAVVRETGERVAVKVQYPGVQRAIDSDLKLLRTLLKVGGLLPNTPKLDAIFAEAKSVLHQELDYRREKTLTDGYRDRLAGDARFCVPRTHARYCTERVLTTSFETGVALDSPEVRALPQARRDRLGTDFLELFFLELFVHREVQTDSHFGNYRVRLGNSAQEPDVLVLLDFGAVRTVSPEFLARYRRLVRAAQDRDRSALHAALDGLGMLPEEVTDAADDFIGAFLEVCQLVLEPFATESYDWGSTDLPSRLSSLGRSLVFDPRVRLPPREMISLDRKTVGVFFVLRELRARVAGRGLLESYLARGD